MPVLSLCPASLDIYVRRGDEMPFTTTLYGSTGQPFNLTGYTVNLVVDSLQNPPNTSTQLFTVTGVVTNASQGVVQFALSSLQAMTAAGRYYYDLVILDGLGHMLRMAEGRMLFVDSCEANMVSDVDLCNMALGFIGEAALVSSISPPDTTIQSQLCAKFYPMALRSTLEMHNWAFATRRTECTAVTPPAEGAPGHVHGSSETCDCSEWEYYYQLPPHFLKAIAVLPHDSSDDYTDSANFTVQLDGLGVPRLYTDQKDAVLLYTEFVVEPQLFPPTFQLAVAWHLASMLAGALIKSEEGAQQAQRCLQTMTMYLGRATKADADVRRMHPEKQASWITNR